MGERSTWLARLHPAWIGLFAFGLYSPTTGYGYVNYDDTWLIRDNVLLRELTFDSVWRVLTDLSWEQRHRLGAEYLPVRDLSVMLDHAVYGDWAGGAHLTQVVLYAGCCALLATLSLALFESRALAWMAGAFFAAHPVHVESVAWLSERKGLLGAFFAAWSLLCAVRYLQRNRWTHAAAACVLFTLAVGAKAVTIATAGALILIVLWLESPAARKKKIAFVCAYGASGLLIFIPYVWVARSFGVIAGDGGDGLLDSLLLFFQAHTQYLKLMAFGGPYAIRYPIEPGVVVTLGQWLPGALAAAAGFALVVWALFARSARTATIFGFGWWLVFLAPASHLFATVQNVTADRYLLLPSFGLLLSVAALLGRLPRRTSWLVAAILVVVGCGWTIAQMPAWSSSDRLFQNAVEVAPSNTEAWDKLAASASAEGELERAWDYTVRGLEYSPNHWRLLHRQGLLLSDAGRLEPAIDVMRRAASVPEAHVAYANLALLYLRAGDQDQARRAAEDAVRLQPDTAHNQRVLGVVTQELGDTETACRAFARAYALDSYDEANVRNLHLCDRESEARDLGVGED